MKSRARLNGVLLVVFLATLGLHAWLRHDPAQPNVEFLPEMVRTERYNAFSPNANFADGKTLQTPVPGTIPRGRLPLQFTASPEDARQAGAELRNPFPAGDSAALARGKFIYENYCQVCHGPGGSGDGAVVRRGFPGPPSFLSETSLGMSDGRMFHVLTYGQGNMPGYAAQVSREDRWKAILHVRELQKKTAGAAPQQAGGQR